MEECTAALSDHVLPKDISLADEMIKVGQWMKENEIKGDSYGSGEFLNAFEDKVLNP